MSELDAKLGKLRFNMPKIRLHLRAYSCFHFLFPMKVQDVHSCAAVVQILRLP
jgi:hypothetical protein